MKLPALSPTMEAGMIVSWEKEVGDELSEGDILAQVKEMEGEVEEEREERGGRRGRCLQQFGGFATLCLL